MLGATQWARLSQWTSVQTDRVKHSSSNNQMFPGLSRWQVKEHLNWFSKLYFNFHACRYHYVSEHSHLIPRDHRRDIYVKAVQVFLWKTIKIETLCCCVSKFYCTTSTNLEKCSEGCCRKCSNINQEEEPSTSSESNSDSWQSDLDSECGTTERSSSVKSSDEFSY